jgi:hypothetical protein
VDERLIRSHTDWRENPMSDELQRDARREDDERPTDEEPDFEGHRDAQRDAQRDGSPDELDRDVRERDAGPGRDA